MIFDTFIRRPRLAMVISILMVLVGIIAMTMIPVSQYPNIAPSTIEVTANYPGANALSVEESVAQPIESAVNGVENMKYMKSTSSDDGSYKLTASFTLGSDPDIDTVNVQNRTALAESTLPEDVRREGLSVKKVSSDLLQVFTFYSPTNKFDQLFISNFIKINILDELKRLPGVGDALIFGQRDYAIRIWIDPNKLANLNLTAADVAAALRSQNVQAAAGRIGAAPVSDNQKLQLTVTTKGRLTSTKEFENVILRADPDGSYVRIRDVAKVELNAASFDVGARYQGGPAALIGINLSPGANAVQTAEAVSKKLEELTQRFPEGLTYSTIYNTAEFVNEMISKVIHALLEAFALVAAVVFIFLGRLRPTLIPLIAVPVAIIGALGVMLAFGFTANTISMLALVLAIGIVVDDAIIVVENVERVMEEEPHLSPAAATSKAMSEIAGSIIAITLVLLSVFIPVAFLPGASGALFREFAVAISAAMVISAINALTLSPALCTLFLRPGRPIGPMRKISSAIDRIGRGYAGSIRRLARIAVISLAAVIGIGFASGWMINHTPSGFVPDEDKGFLIVVANLPPGAAINRTDAAMRKAEAIVAKDPVVASVSTVLGLDFLGGGAAPNMAVMFIRLKSYAERTTPEMSAFSAIPRMFRALSVIPEASFIPLNPPAISGLGQTGGFEYVLEALQGQKPADIAAVIRSLTISGNANPTISRLFTTFEAETPQVRLDIDRDKARSLGIKIVDVFSALQATLGGYYVNDFNLFGRTWTVRIQAKREFRSSIDDINDIRIRTASGEMVPMSSIATPHLAVGPRSIVRYNNYRAAVLNGSPAVGFGAGEAIAAMTTLSKQDLPGGFTFEWTGQALEQIESAGKAPIVISLAFVFAFLFLVALYESWNVPAAVLLSVSVAVLGAVVGIEVAGLSFDLYAQIGIVVLIALAAKNAILINTFSLEQRSAGHDLVSSAVNGARLRFRPVMMTSFSFILGLVPLVIATGPGAGSMVAVGVPVFAGMLASATLGILLIPMLYMTFQWMREKTGWRPESEKPPETDAQGKAAPKA